jgi:hypothetical protein
VEANASLDSLKPRFYVEAHLSHLFETASSLAGERTEQVVAQEEAHASESSEQEERPVLMSLPNSLSSEQDEELAQRNAARHDWIEPLGAQDRRVTHRSYQRIADLRVSTTDPHATLMERSNGSDMGYRTHYVVDGGRARIIMAALVTPFEVTDNQPMLDLLWRVRFRWKLWPRHVTGDTKYGTEDNIVAIEDQHIHAYVPLPDNDHRTAFFSADRAFAMSRNVMSTSVQQAKNCTFFRPTLQIGSAAIGHVPKTVITVRSKPQVVEKCSHKAHR